VRGKAEMDILSRYITETYGIDCIPGGKVACPKCGHKTFALKRDGSIAKCFHPGCSWVITPRCIESRPSLHKLLSGLLQQWHKHLLEPGDFHQKAALEFLIKGRGIAQSVIEAAAIGLVPENPDINTPLRNILNELRATPKRKQYDSKTTSNFDPLAYANFLEGQGTDLIAKVSMLRGWLAFFYQDSKGRWCAIHFRKPSTKKFATFKPKGMGIFGKDIFIPNCSKSLAELNQYGIIVEGEFDCLKIQSVIVEAGWDPALVVATGGTSLIDTETIAGLIPKPIICKDNDSAGADMVETISARMHCEVCAPPSGYKDIDEYLSSFKGRPTAAYDALKDILNNRGLKFQPFDAVREKIDNIRKGYPPTRKSEYGEKSVKLKTFEIERLVSEAIIDDMSVRGSFYRDGDQCFYLDKQTKKLIALERGGIGISLLLNNYGLNSTEKLFIYVVEALTMYCLPKGCKVNIRHYSHCRADTKPFMLFIAVSDNSMLRVTHDAVELVDNGTDGIIFLSGESAVSSDVFHRKPSEASKLLDKLILQRIPFLPGKLSRSESQFLLKCWIIGFLFRSILPTMPLLAFIGPKGSGKTTALRLIGKLLCGESWDVIPVGDDEKDFDTLITSKHLVGLDNVDVHKKWLNDKLAVVATGATIQKRELYTTNQSREFPIIASLAITSRTPSFRRDDVAERLLILETARIDESRHTDFMPDFDILNEVIPRRSEIWAELIKCCQAVLAVMGDTDIRQIKVPGARMQDFARFTVMVGKALGCESMARGIWDKLIAIQNEFTLEEDSLCEVLISWAESNAGRHITAGELNIELREIADARGLKWPYKSGKSLAQRLRHLKPNLKHFLRIEEEPGPKKQTLYAFYPIEEPPSAADSGAIPESIPENETRIGSGIDAEFRNHRNQIEENYEKKGVIDETKYITCDNSLVANPGSHKSALSTHIEKPPDVHEDKVSEVAEESVHTGRNRHRNRGGIYPSPHPDDLPEQYRQLFIERAAIREFDGGLSRDDAERSALEDVKRLMEIKFLN